VVAGDIAGEIVETLTIEKAIVENIVEIFRY